MIQGTNVKNQMGDLPKNKQRIWLGIVIGQFNFYYLVGHKLLTWVIRIKNSILKKNIDLSN